MIWYRMIHMIRSGITSYDKIRYMFWTCSWHVPQKMRLENDFSPKRFGGVWAIIWHHRGSLRRVLKLIMCKTRFLKDVLSEITTFAPGRESQKASKSFPKPFETTFQRVSKIESEKTLKQILCYSLGKKVRPLKPFPNPFLVPKTPLRLCRRPDLWIPWAWRGIGDHPL